MKRTTILAAALLAGLSACGEEAAEPEEGTEAEQGGEAIGDVEGGSISDAMIPLESLSSQSPTLERQPDSDGGARSEPSTAAPSASDPEPSAPPAEPSAPAAPAAPAAPSVAPPVAPPAAPDGRGG